MVAVPQAIAPRPELYQIQDGKLRLTLHAGQTQVWDSDARITAMIAGTQSGKTSFGPWWLYREIYGGWGRRGRGPGDYLAVTTTFDLYKLKLLPELRQVLERTLRVARFWSGDRVLELRDPDTGQFWAERADDPMWGRIILRSAAAESGLESATALAAWLDEAGMDDFPLTAWDAIMRRLSLALGRVLITTTPYNLGWLKQQVYDPWQGGYDDYRVVQFASSVNPAFSQEAMDEARRRLPGWKYAMFYLGQFERPAGLIYDVFDARRDTCPRFPVPTSWPRYLGLDFGGVNTAGLFYAEEPGTDKLYLYREYHAGGRTAAEHTEHLLEDEPGIPLAVGGSKSEGQWRDEFTAAGLPVREPDISEVEVGIDRVYGAHKQHQIVVFDDLAGYLDEKARYHRELDAMGNVTEKIADKNTFHRMDAERYIVGWLKRTSTAPTMRQGRVKGRTRR